jgi:hypothetical protein
MHALSLCVSCTAFPSIAAAPAVLYPSINMAAYDVPPGPPPAAFTAYSQTPTYVHVRLCASLSVRLFVRACAIHSVCM